uniref:Uncharacterized protein n=1 Tax=Photinus pyralis TaxID=7054 RepID=A0A1Y1KGY8_PHOPY
MLHTRGSNRGTFGNEDDTEITRDSDSGWSVYSFVAPALRVKVERFHRIGIHSLTHKQGLRTSKRIMLIAEFPPGQRRLNLRRYCLSERYIRKEVRQIWSDIMMIGAQNS